MAKDPRPAELSTDLLLQGSSATKRSRSDHKIRGGDWCDICARVVKLMRELSGVEYEDQRPDGRRPANLDDLHRRHQEYGPEACELVAADRAHRWLVSRGARSGDMEDYYRPSTIFRPSHFPEYLAAARAVATKQRTDEWGRCRKHGTYQCRSCTTGPGS